MDQLGESDSESEVAVTTLASKVYKEDNDDFSVSSGESSSGKKKGAGSGGNDAVGKKKLVLKKKNNKASEGEKKEKGKKKKKKKEKKDKKGQGKKNKTENKGSGSESEASMDEDEDDDDDDMDDQVDESDDQAGAEEGTKKKKKKSKAAGPEDDDKFIDSDDDNAELAEEYNQEQQDFSSDEDPYEDDKKPEGFHERRIASKMSGSKMSSSKNDDQDGGETNFLKKHLAEVAERRKVARTKLSEEEVITMVDGVLAKMKEKVMLDEAARANLKPATHKLGMLEEVVECLLRKDLQIAMLDRGALKWLGEWLRPNKVDKKLPAQSIRNRLIGILPQLNISLEHLQKSQFGKLVNFLSQHQNETAPNKEILTSLMQNWAKNIFSKEDSSRRDVDGSDNEEAPNGAPGSPQRRPPSPAKRASSPAKPPPKPALAELGKERVSAASEASAHRARIPQARNFNFKIAPTTNKRTAEDAKLDSLRPSTKRLEMEKELIKIRKKRTGGGV